MNVSAVEPIRRARLYIIGNLLDLINFSPVRYITYEQTAATLIRARLLVAFLFTGTQKRLFVSFSLLSH